MMHRGDGMTPQPHVGQQLSRERQRQGLTTRKAGKLSGLHHTTIVRLERRGLGESLSTLRSYARQLGFDVQVRLRRFGG
jgi:transcriptional regulator with XRE-family HTH domain